MLIAALRIHPRSTGDEGVPFRHADRVKETSSTTGTGTYSLGGAASGFRSFVAAVGNGNRCTYAVVDGATWEINEGVVTDASPDTLTRARFIDSSTGSPIDWGSGSRLVYCIYSAADMNPRTVSLSSDSALSSTTGIEVTGLQFTAVQPGTYCLQYWIAWQTATTTVGKAFAVNFTGTTSLQVINGRHVTTGTTAATGSADDVANTATGQLVEGRAQVTFATTAPNLGPNTAGAATANANLLFFIEALIVVTAAGDLELWHSSETATSTTIKAGSSGILTRTA